MAKILSLRAIVALTAVSLSIVIVFALLRPFRAETVIERWRRQIDEKSESEASAAVLHLASFGRPAIPLLVELVGSLRPAVAAAATESLRLRLEEFQRLPTEDSMVEIDLLVTALAKHVDEFGPAGKLFAAELTRYAIRIPTRSDAINRFEFNTNCRKILMATRTQQQRAAQPAALVADDPHEARVFQPLANQAALLGSPNDIDELLQVADVPGGGLSMGDLEPPRVAVRPASPKSSEFAEPEPFPLQPVRIDEGPVRPELFWRTPQLNRLDPPADRETGATSDQDRRAETSVETANRLAGGPWENLPVEQVIYQLGHDDPHAASEAQSELQRRGFRPAEIAIAQRLASSDHRARRALVNELPRISGIDARPWLLQLAQDRDGDVRLAALASLASLNDPEILAQVVELARGDSDPRIVRLAEQLRR